MTATPGFDPHETTEQLRRKREQEEAQKKPNGHAGDAKPALRAVTVGELLAIALPPRVELLGPWLTTKSLVMIYGPRGEGKTYIGLGIAKALSTAGKYLCWQANEERNVLYVDGELPAEVLQERSRELSIPNDAKLKIVTPDLQDRPMPNLGTEEGQAELEPQVEWADVLLLDNLACLCNSGDENERQPWLVMQGWLLALRRRGKTIVLMHHSGKGGDQRGTSAREDTLDTVVKLKRPADYRDDEGLRAEWYFTKHRGFHGDAALPIEVQLIKHPSAPGLTWTWSPLETSLAAQVAEMLNETDLSLRDIAGDMGLSKSAVHRLKNKAAALGLLKRE